MKEFVDRITRPSRKWSDQFIIAAILSVVLTLAGEIISEIVYKAAHAREFLVRMLGSDNLAAFFTTYLSFFGIWLAALLLIAIPRSNRPMLKAWGCNREGNTIKAAAIGALLGFGTNGFCVLMSVLMGDIKLSYFGFNPAILLGFLFVVFIQAAAEEITDRLYLYQKLRRRYKSPLIAILVNPVVFMLVHVFNDGFTILAGVQIVLVGIIFSLIVYYYNSLWAAMCFHTLWNYTQNIIFGLPNSGAVSEYSIFKLEAASATSGFFYDVGFGVEGSIGSTLVLAVVLAAILFINRGNGEKRDYWADAAIDAGYERE